jgi:uncharacterized protein (UPF0332 family)
MSDRDLVRGELKQAEQALADATGALDANLSDAVVVNRLYYACFHAAQAVLYDRGYEPESHGAVLSLFGSEIVVAGDVSRDQGRLLNDLSTLRKQADYGYESIDEDVDALLDQVETLVADAERLLDEQG